MKKKRYNDGFYYYGIQEINAEPKHFNNRPQSTRTYDFAKSGFAHKKEIYDQGRKFDENGNYNLWYNNYNDIINDMPEKPETCSYTLSVPFVKKPDESTKSKEVHQWHELDSTGWNESTISPDIVNQTKNIQRTQNDAHERVVEQNNDLLQWNANKLAATLLPVENPNVNYAGVWNESTISPDYVTQPQESKPESSEKELELKKEKEESSEFEEV